VFPLAGTYRGDTLLLSVQNATLTFSFGQVPLRRLDMRFQLDRSLHARPGASLYAESVCAEIPNYGPSTYLTGICNAQGILPAAGTFITDPYPTAGQANRRPRGVTVSSVALQQPTVATPGSVTVTLAHGSRYQAAEHRVGVLLVDQSGQPLGLDYTNQRTTTNARGDITSVTLTIPAGTTMPSHLSAYVMADVFPLSSRQLY
jgi:hypothetical protein